METKKYIQTIANFIGSCTKSYNSAEIIQIEYYLNFAINAIFNIIMCQKDEYNFLTFIDDDISKFSDIRMLNESENLEMLNNIFRKIKIIEKWKFINFNTKSVGVPITHFHTTDTHGDLNALLYSLIGSSATIYKPNAPSILFFDITNGKTYEDFEDCAKETGNMLNIRIIPNLIINPCFNDILTIGGDIIDRGTESEESVCLMYYLLNQKNSENKIKLLVGNHEDALLRRDFNCALDNGANSLFCLRNRYEEDNTALYISLGLEKNLVHLRNLMIDLIRSNKMQLCYLDSDTIFLHTILKKIALLEAMKKFYTGEEIISLYNKIFFNRSFDITDLKNMTECLNVIFKVYVDLLENNEVLPSFIQKIFCFQTGVLWARPQLGASGIINNDSISGLKQVVGHSIINSSQAVKYDNIIYTDIGQCYLLRENDTTCASLCVCVEGVFKEQYICEVKLNHDKTDANNQSFHYGVLLLKEHKYSFNTEEKHTDPENKEHIDEYVNSTVFNNDKEISMEDVSINIQTELPKTELLMETASVPDQIELQVRTEPPIESIGIREQTELLPDNKQDLLKRITSALKLFCCCIPCIDRSE